VPPPQGAAELANDSNVHSLRAFLTLPSLELNFRALGERFKAISRDLAEVHEQILTAVRRSNKPELPITLAPTRPTRPPDRHAGSTERSPGSRQRHALSICEALRSLRRCSREGLICGSAGVGIA
jgi:hypothetical protein